MGNQHGVEVGSSYAAAAPQGPLHGMAPAAQPPGESSTFTGFAAVSASLWLEQLCVMMLVNLGSVSTGSSCKRKLISTTMVHMDSRMQLQGKLHRPQQTDFQAW